MVKFRDSSKYTKTVNRFEHLKSNFGTYKSEILSVINGGL